MKSTLQKKDSPLPFINWLKNQVENEKYWFHRIELAPGIITPGWSDPQKEKLPYFGLPDDMTGMRVLDIGTAEGFFAFEAERRGAKEVVAIDSFPDSVRRFNIGRAAFNSNATAFLCNVYDLSRKSFGTFDLVLFFGVLYHLRHPLLALEKIFEVCTGTLLMQTATYEIPGNEDIPLAKFNPGWMASGKQGELKDPTIFWLPNNMGVKMMVEAMEFQNVEIISTIPGAVLRAESPSKSPGIAPDQTKAPWS